MGLLISWTFFIPCLHGDGGIGRRLSMLIAVDFKSIVVDFKSYEMFRILSLYFDLRDCHSSIRLHFYLLVFEIIIFLIIYRCTLESAAGRFSTSFVIIALHFYSVK